MAVGEFHVFDVTVFGISSLNVQLAGFTAQAILQVARWIDAASVTILRIAFVILSLGIGGVGDSLRGERTL
jgi:hypothetical protein